MTLLELFHLLRKHLKLVIILPLACALGTALFSFVAMPDQYTATISMYVLSKSSSSSSSDSVSYNDLSASQMLANDFAKLAKSERIISATADDLGMKSLDGYTIKVTSSTTTRVIEVGVTGTDARATMTVANQMGDELSKTAVSIMNVQSVNILDSAQLPTTASGPPRLMYTLVALLVGLFLAIAIVVIADMADTTIKSPQYAERTLDLPVLGRFPFIKDLKKGSSVLKSLPELQNAAKTLMANIRFSSLDDDIRTINITSSVPNEGKTTTVVALGEAYASAGHTVLLVEGDMRRRSLAHALKLAPTAGSYSVLTGGSTLQEAVCATGIVNLFFLDVEPNIPNPADILSSERYKSFIENLSETFDYVIFDTPPLGTFIDAAIMGTNTDGTLLVVRRGKVKRTVAQSVVKQMKQASVHTLGSVLTFCEDDSTDYYYKYYTKAEMAKKNKRFGK